MKYAAEPPPKRARAIEATSQWSHITVTSEDRFIPLTPDNKRASESSTTKSDRSCSGTSEDEGTGPSKAMENSEYPPVSGVEPEPRGIKTEDLRLAQSVQVLIQHQPTT